MTFPKYQKLKDFGLLRDKFSNWLFADKKMSPSECKALMFDFSQQLIEINKFTKTGIKKTLKKHGDFSISLVSYMYTNNIYGL